MREGTRDEKMQLQLKLKVLLKVATTTTRHEPFDIIGKYG